MMNVMVQYYALIREVVQKEEEEIVLPEKSSIRDLMELLIKEYGEDFKNLFFERNGDIAHRILIFVNGSDFDLAKDENMTLENGSKVQFFQPIGGG